MPKKDLEAAYLQTLAQTVAEREKELNDYACNTLADKIAQINMVLALLDPQDPEDKRIQEELITVKEIYRKLGTALWFMQAGEITNLGARLGSTIKQFRVRE